MLTYRDIATDRHLSALPLSRLLSSLLHWLVRPGIPMVAIDAAKVAAQKGFKRSNPKTDLFKVRKL